MAWPRGRPRKRTPNLRYSTDYDVPNGNSDRPQEDIDAGATSGAGSPRGTPRGSASQGPVGDQDEASIESQGGKSRGRGRGRGGGRGRGRRRTTSTNGIGHKNNLSDHKDVGDDSLNETEVSRRPWIARKPLYSTEYLDALDGTEMRCSICTEYSTTNAQEARDHLLKSHYNCARMNGSEEFTMKEIRSALRTASLTMGPGAKFVCVCGVEYLNSITFSIHLTKCSDHKIRIKSEEVTPVQNNVREGDEPETAEGERINAKRRRKSALKATVTFSRLAKEELADEDGNLPLKSKNKSSTGNAKGEGAEANTRDREGDDQDYKYGSSEEASEEADEDFGVSEADDSDFGQSNKPESRKSRVVSTTRTGTKCLDILLNKFRGKYREPIPVPICDETRTNWRHSLTEHGRITCRDCGVQYTTFCGMEYHFQRCNKLEYGYKCLRCSIYFPRGGNRALLSHLRICLDSQGIEDGGYPSSASMRVTSASRKHDQSPRDFVEFSKRHYEGPQATKVVHPSWEYQHAMWPRISPQQADQYLTSMTTSPLIKIKRTAAHNDEVMPRLLDLHASFTGEDSEHDAIYVGGAVWAVKWVPLPNWYGNSSSKTSNSRTPESESVIGSASAQQQSTDERRDSQNDCNNLPNGSGENRRREEYLLTVSHSKGSQPELMQMNKNSVVMIDGKLSRGSLSLWAVLLDKEHLSNESSPNGCNTEDMSVAVAGEGTERRVQQRNSEKSRVRRCYTICHEWGFVARVEFCPSRAFTENRIGLLAVTAQSGFVRILALPHPTADNGGAFYLDPVPVAILEPAEMSGSLCVAWDPLRDHGHMLVGYANGNVDMFTLKQCSLLVTEDEALEPSKRLGSHGLSVSSVQWHYLAERRIAVSSGFDNNIITWDIDSGTMLGKYSRLMSRDMRTLQFLPSVVASFEESITPSPCVAVFESGAYKRSESTILAYTVGTAFGLDVNHWRHMVAFTDSAGLVTLAWVTNAGKLRNFRNRGVQVVLFQARQSFPEGVDTLSEEVAHGVGTVEFTDFSPSWQSPTPTQSLNISPPARLEYPLNSVLSVAFNPNYPIGDHLVASGLRCGVVRISRVDYNTALGTNNQHTLVEANSKSRCKAGWRGKISRTAAIEEKSC